MKKKWMKFTSMLMAVVMVLSMSLVGFAAEIEPLASSPETTGSITIDNAANGESYIIYQIFDLTYADDKSSYSYKVTDAWANFFATGAAGANYVTLDDNGYVIANEITGSEQAFAKAALAYAEESEITGTTEVASNNTVKFENLPLGYYLVETTQGSLCALTSTDPEVTIEEKWPTPSITKEILEDDYSRKEEDIEHDDNNGHFEENETGDGWGTWDDADNNQTIVYHLTLNDINGALNLTVHDYLETGLDFTKIENIVLYKNANDEGTTLEEDTDYILTEGECSDPTCQMDACTFEIHFVSEDGTYDLTRLFDDLTSDAYLVITYDALTNTHANDYTDYEDDILNHAYLTYGTASYSTVITTETELFGFGVYKYSGEIATALEGAEFILSKGTGENTRYAYFLTETDSDDNVYYLVEGWVSSEDELPDGDYTMNLVSGEDGYIRIEGLDDDTYYLTETVAPDGYNMLTSSITVVIDEDGSITVNGTENGEKETGVHVVDVENNSGTELPSTGGMGTTIFYIIGTVLVLAAAALMLAKWRMGKTE